MRPAYEGIKFYSDSDLSLGHYYQATVLILERLDIAKLFSDINEVIELFHVYQIITSSGIKTEYTAPYANQAKTILSIVARYFSNISNDSVLKVFRSVCVMYIEDFWTLFDKFKLYERISDTTFTSLLVQPDSNLREILKHKGLVGHYDNTLAEFMRHSSMTAIILIGKFLEKNQFDPKESCYLPTSLNACEFERILDKFITLESNNIGMLQLISRSMSSIDFPISDGLRLSAKNKAYELINSYSKTHKEDIQDDYGRFSYGISVSFRHNQEPVITEKVGPLDFLFTYDSQWITENLDYPTLLNNFIYLFEYVDLCYRCQFVSIRSELSITESTLNIRGIKDYESGVSFKLKNAKSFLDLLGYTKILSNLNIYIEEIIQWFFSDYLTSEFDANGFLSRMSSRECTFLEKCRNLLSELDGLMKQYKMYVENGSIDRSLFEMSSNHVSFQNLPSMIDKKYAYADSKELNREQFLLFSNQSPLHFLHNYGEAQSFFDLLSKNEVKKSDYPESNISDLLWLKSRKTISLDENEIIHLNPPKVKLLQDLYKYEVLCASYYDNAELIEELVASEELRYESTLFTIPEQHYLNYMLNKAQYSNGLDIRNRYIHGTNSMDEKVHEQDYIHILKIMILFILKVNEEFVLDSIQNPKNAASAILNNENSNPSELLGEHELH